MLSIPAPTLPHSLFSRFDFSARHSLLVAVSGGSDSTALLLLLKDYLAERAPLTRIVAATVNHGLRQDAGKEAEAVAELCARNGIPHQILMWRGEKPSTGVAAVARKVRYALLAKAAREAGTDVLLVGHTADDQAETVLMRAGRGIGQGLSGMAPATLLDGNVWIVRPLLSERRSTLRQFLSGRRVSWIEDPTNMSPRSERARSRALLAGSDDRVGRLLLQASATARERQNLAERAGALIGSIVRQESPGLIRIAPRVAADEDQDGAIHAFRILLATAGGTSFLPDLPRTVALFSKRDEPSYRATLSRCVAHFCRSGIFLWRELRNLPAIVPIKEELLWDGRYRLVPPRVRQACEVGPCGRDCDMFALEDRTGGTLPLNVARLALAAQPALFRDGVCIGPLAGNESGWRCEPIAAPFGRYLLSFDLAAAAAVSRLIGAPQPPPPPFASHNMSAA